MTTSATGEQVERLITAIERLAGALEGATTGNGQALPDRSTAAQETGETVGLMNEAKMAKHLNIPKRSLGQYRRQGRLPGCWLKNGKRVYWRPAETVEAWRRGIA
jgi:hypothetical protein